ncbi:MAG TPA: zf-HC2 domain-containing protein [Bacilli bacterium]
MKCEEVQDMLGTYWDFSEDDSDRIAVDVHLETCSSCSEEFNIWRESMTLIHTSAIRLVDPVKTSRIRSSVMDRIYSDEAWRIPIPDRVYSISYRLRMKMTVIIASCLALFMIGFIYSILSEDSLSLKGDNLSGLFPAASALGDGNIDSPNNSGTFKFVPVASISDPFFLKVNPIQSFPDYLLAISLLGLFCALLIMNWLSRIRA